MTTQSSVIATNQPTVSVSGYAWGKGTQSYFHVPGQWEKREKGSVRFSQGGA